MEDLINITLLAFLLFIAFVVIRHVSLFGVVIMSGIYSLLSAALFVALDAVDVAFTEAAVGAGVSTILMLAGLALTTREEKATRIRRPLFPLFVVVLTGMALIYGTLDMPGYGRTDSPIHHHVADRYMNQSATEIGIPNVVTSVLASYRGYDTLGETTVVFTAATGILALLGGYGRRGPQPKVKRRSRPDPMRRQGILRATTKLMIPFFLVFALYVQFHGDFGPGGGFQAGVLFGTAFIGYALIYGVGPARRIAPLRFVASWMGLGVIVYATVGVAGLLMGGAFLEYDVLLHDPVHGQHLGINLVEFGVGMTVSSAMVSIFLTFVAQDNRRFGELELQ